MATKPRTLNLCWKHIERLEEENEAMSDALHKMKNECAVMLSEKDGERLSMCKKCARGIR